MWDSQELALTKEQKQKLLKIRKETLKTISQIKAKVAKLEASIKSKLDNGASPKELKKKIKKLAKLKRKATMTHLKCIYQTKKVLSKKQLQIISN
jgi:Spy/CpxP family protein refolding chaperone